MSDSPVADPLKLAQVAPRPLQHEQRETGPERGCTPPVEQVGVVEVRMDDLAPERPEHAAREHSDRVRRR